MKRVGFVGLDVHAETIAVAVAETDGEFRSLGVIPNRAHAGSAPPTVVFGGIGGVKGADGIPGAITGWNRR
jgi:hypothetical protein